MMFATMIVQGGELPRVLSCAMCEYIQGAYDKVPEIEEVAGVNVRMSLKKVIWGTEIVK